MCTCLFSCALGCVCSWTCRRRSSIINQFPGTLLHDHITRDSSNQVPAQGNLPSWIAGFLFGLVPLLSWAWTPPSHSPKWLIIPDISVLPMGPRLYMCMHISNSRCLLPVTHMLFTVTLEMLPVLLTSQKSSHNAALSSLLYAPLPVLLCWLKRPQRCSCILYDVWKQLPYLISRDHANRFLNHANFFEKEWYIMLKNILWNVVFKQRR